MNVLSLFDGMSCGQIALERAGVKVDNYFASEIDKYAIQVAKDNYPDTIHLGNVEEWEKWDLPNIDMLIGGSPCQGFSNCGEGLNFSDSRSELFFHYIEILKKYKPKYFLLENVKMKAEWRDIITKYIGIRPVLINSAMFSAQNRERYYWTNIPIDVIIDKNIKLVDIIENGMVDRDKSYCIDANYYKGRNLDQYLNKSRRQLVFNEATKKGFVEIPQMCGVDLACIKSKTRRGRKMQHKSNCLQTSNQFHWYDGLKLRKLTPIECERLQTVPDNYTASVSNTQRYKMLGNGWTVDVIAHIFKGIDY